ARMAITKDSLRLDRLSMALATSIVANCCTTKRRNRDVRRKFRQFDSPPYEQTCPPRRLSGLSSRPQEVLARPDPDRPHAAQPPDRTHARVGPGTVHLRAVLSPCDVSPTSAQGRVRSRR